MSATQFELLGSPGADDHFVWRRCTFGGAAAPLLQKRTRQTWPTRAERAALERECVIAAAVPATSELRPRWVEADATLVLQDPGGVPLSARMPGPLAVDAWLRLALQLTQSLADLHRAGWLHNGVRPDVVLWHAQSARAWLFDFGDAAVPAARRMHLGGAAATAERLVYLSPEQTGRLERSADARSDLYSLGVLLYEALTGAPPFRSGDALAQVHWHLAGVARAPAEMNPGLPVILSDVVMKLLAKPPEERYQSALGLLHDLETCARDWAAQRASVRFALGSRDLGEQLVISPRLVGREREVHTLLEAFETVCRGDGSASMLLVEGYSGIGKTALIQQLVRPIVRRRGYFISGKFDQVVRGIPFGALIQAFRSLVRELLTEDEPRLAAWRETLSAALGSQGGVLAAVMPEIEFIVGKQPEPAALGNVEAQNRFQRVLQSVLAALARPEHPLVVFLDDLQWADPATLGLLEPLLAGQAIHGLMLMGAYRDNELNASPHLARTLSALASAGVVLQRVSLGPLQPAHVTSLVADSLNCNACDAAPLAQLVHAKTGGNPFFVIQFLRALERDGHLQLDREQSRWVYRIERIADAPLADNVIELMTRTIERLPSKSQRVLMLSACIGNRFDLSTLAAVSEQSPEQTALDLGPAVAEGLIVSASRRAGAAPHPFNKTNGRNRVPPGAADAPQTQAASEAAQFAFLHDRVQQSAYAMLPAERRRWVHLAVGRLLRSCVQTNDGEAAAFDIVHHLNLGRALIPAGPERREVAMLNLAAGRRAKSSTAHDTARELFQSGCELLAFATPDAWVRDHALCFELHLEAAESLYLCGQFEAALVAMNELAERANGPVERARVMGLRSVQYENMGRYDDALAAMRRGLALLGVTLPDQPAELEAALEREIDAVERRRGARAIDAFADLPVMTDPQVQMVMEMLTGIWSVSFLTGAPTLARLISATLVRLSLEHGNAPESAYGYVTHAITVGPLRGAYAEAHAYGLLALEVNRRFDDARLRAKIYQQFHAHVNLWCRPLDTCVAYAREAWRTGLESGDFLYAAYAAGTEPWAALLSTQDLAVFVRDYTPNVELIERLKNAPFADSVRLILNWARALQGLTRAPLSLSDPTLDEDAFVRTYRANPFFASIHAVARLHVCALLGTPAQALAAAQHAAALVGSVPGTIWPVLHEFWYAWTLAENFGTAPAGERDAWRTQIGAAHAAFELRAGFCAENFGCQALLLRAECARVEGRERDAIAAFEQAIESAAATQSLPYQALAFERLGRCRARLAQPWLARNALALARDAYAAWGARAKVRAIENEFSDLAAPATLRTLGAAPSFAFQQAAEDGALYADEDGVGAADGLDLFSALKAAQAIAGEVEFSALLARLLHIAIENAGAERGALVLEGNGSAQVYLSEVAHNGPGVLQGGALDGSGAVPVGIVNFVRRTGQTVVLGRAEGDEAHASDAYVLCYRPRSLACLPLRRLGQSVGVLLLEHRHVDGIFTPPRLRMLDMLAAQAAISLDNAGLIAALKQENEQRRHAQDQLGAALAEVKQLKDDLEAENTYLRRDLIANVSHDLRTPLVSMRGYLELLASRGEGLTAVQRQQYLDIAVRQSEHLAGLIDELFELAKLDFKGMTLACEPFSFAELAADVAQKFGLDANRRQVELRVEAAPRLPFVNADLSLMERVLENLIGNALRHTPPAGCVTVTLHSDAERLVAHVEDTGSGIPSAELPFVFDRFYRGANGRTAGSGAGLGLAIAKRIVALHQGEIRVDSDANSGTRFTFSLPLHRP